MAQLDHDELNGDGPRPDELRPALQRAAPVRDRWSARETRAQYAAIAWLRWRILVNSFRRKGGGGELAARILTYPIAALFMLGPTAGAGLGSWYLASQGSLDRISLVLWGIFAFCQLLNINLGQPGTTFDPTELIRFPMRLRSYVAVRLFFGLMAPANIVVTAMSMAVALGVSIAIPALWPYALLSMALFAAANVFFTRMIFAWIDRWMSTRRAREVFTALVFTLSIGFQYVNVTFNPAYNHHHARRVSQERMDTARRLYHRTEPVLAALPPGLTGNALLAAEAGAPARAFALMAGCSLFGAAFLGVFTLRMRKEFHGENLSDVANAVARPPRTASAASRAVAATVHGEVQVTRGGRFLGLSPHVAVLLGRELLYLRRNTGMFYGLVAPLAMVMLFAGKLASRSNNFWIFPAALAYALLGLSPLAYNAFGLEGAGIQFFFLAPVRLRDVFLAKNLMNLLVAVVEGVAVYVIIRYISVPPTGEMVIVGGMWAAGTMLFGNTVGNLRSVSAPKKINLNRTASKQASPLSALMSIGLLLVAAAFGAGMLLLARYFDLHWLLIPTMLVYAITGLLVYLTGLRSIERYALNRRESMFEELCKAA